MKKTINFMMGMMIGFMKIGGIWWFVYMVYVLLNENIHVRNGATAVEWAMIIWLTIVSGVITVETIGGWITNIWKWIKTKKDEVAA